MNRSAFIVVAVAVLIILALSWAHGQEAPKRPTAGDLQVQLLEQEVRNYRNSVAQLAEANQKLQDQLTEVQKKCPAEPAK